MRCVAFCSNGIGDHLLLLPALRALAAAFPGQVTGVFPTGLAETFFGDVALARTIPLRTWGDPQDRQFDAEGIAAALGPCDLLVCFDRAVSGAHRRLLAALAPRDSVGFFAAFRRVVRFRNDRHAADQAFALVQALDPAAAIEPFVAPAWVEPQARALVEELRARLSARYRLLVAHADTAGDKMWDAGRFGRFFDAFLAEHPGFVVALVGLRVGAPALGGPQPRKFDLTGLPLTVSLALAQQADLFVGIDSCVLHAADLAGVPCVGLFGATDPVEWGLRFTARRALLHELPLRELAVAPVLDACRRVLA